MGDGVDIAKCASEIIEATNEHERSQGDLSAQTEIARWALYMLIATVGMAIITFACVVFVWQTLKVTREIGMAQVRAYVVPFGVRVLPKIVNGVTTNFLFQPIFKNTGQSPAGIAGTQINHSKIRGWKVIAIDTSVTPQEYEIGTGHEFFGTGFGITSEKVNQMLRETRHLEIKITAEYRDIFFRIFRETHRTLFTAIIPITRTIVDCQERFGINVDFDYGAGGENSKHQR